MILSFLFFVFLFYVLFKLVFDFVIPIYKTTRKVKQSFRDINQRMQEQNGTSAAGQQPNRSPNKKQAPASDYIDFEEVKD